MQNVQRIVLVDFGAQYTQLIARRVREAKVFCEVVSYLTPLSEILEKKPVGIILSGGPASVLDADAPHIDPAIYEQGIPVLGICYGMQLTAYTLGGTVERAAQREYGRVPVDFDVNSPLFAGMKAQSVAWMSHTFHVTRAPEGFTSIAHSENCAFCAMANPEKRIYAVQFHPEVTHSEEGQKVIANFLYNVCGCTGDWTMSTFIDNAIASIREQVGPNGRVMLGLSGGVDSSVAAALISRAIGERLTCVYVDHGFMRKNETEEVRAASITAVHLPQGGMPALGDNPLFLGCADYRSTIASNGESSGFTFPEEMRRHADKGTALVTDKDPGDAEIAEVVSQAAAHSCIVLGTYNGHILQGQLRLAKALAATGLPMILVALRNPYDLRNMPNHVAALAGWEYTRPLFDALWPVLNGTARPTGKLPLLTLTKAAK